MCLHIQNLVFKNHYWFTCNNSLCNSKHNWVHITLSTIQLPYIKSILIFPFYLGKPYLVTFILSYKICKRMFHYILFFISETHYLSKVKLVELIMS